MELLCFPAGEPSGVENQNDCCHQQHFPAAMQQRAFSQQEIEKEQRQCGFPSARQQDQQNREQQIAELDPQSVAADLRRGFVGDDQGAVDREEYRDQRLEKRGVRRINENFKRQVGERQHQTQGRDAREPAAADRHIAGKCSCRHR